MLIMVHHYYAHRSTAFSTQTMEKHFCSGGCGYFEEGKFENVGVCEGYKDQECLSAGGDKCPKCIVYIDCPECGVERCENCFNVKEDDERCCWCAAEKFGSGAGSAAESDDSGDKDDSEDDYVPPASEKSKRKQPESDSDEDYRAPRKATKKK